MKVVVAADGSPSSDEAIALLQRTPLPHDSLIHVVSVVDESGVSTLVGHLQPAETENLNRGKEDARGRADGFVQAAMEKLQGTSLKLVPLIRSGNPAEEILRVAEITAADLVVLGARSTTPVRRFLLGSVSEKVVNHACCSVLLAHRRSGGEDPADGGEEVAETAIRTETDAALTVLLAYDDSPMARSAAEDLKRLRLENVRVWLLTVLTVSTTFFRQDILEQLTASWQAYRLQSERNLESLARRFRPLARQVELRLIDGGPDAADEILDMSRQVHADIIMLGRTGCSGIQHFLLGSVASRIARHAPCGVWLAHAGRVN